MPERPDPAIRRRRITRGRVIAATLSVGSAVALTAAIAVTDDAGASSPAQPSGSSDRNSGNSSYSNPSSNTPSYGGPSQADPFSDGGDDQYSGGYDGYSNDGNGFSAPSDAPDTSSPHTSSRGS